MLTGILLNDIYNTVLDQPIKVANKGDTVTILSTFDGYYEVAHTDKSFYVNVDDIIIKE